MQLIAEGVDGEDDDEEEKGENGLSRNDEVRLNAVDNFLILLEKPKLPDIIAQTGAKIKNSMPSFALPLPLPLPLSTSFLLLNFCFILFYFFILCISCMGSWRVWLSLPDIFERGSYGEAQNARSTFERCEYQGTHYHGVNEAVCTEWSMSSESYLLCEPTCEIR